MKILFTATLLFLTIFTAFAQSSSNTNAINVKMLITDYNTLDAQYRIEQPTRIIHPDDINYGMEVGYHRYLNSSFNAGAALRLGSIDAYHLRIDSSDANCTSVPCNRRYFRNELFGTFSLIADYKFNNGYLLKEDFFLAPYFRTGFSALYLYNREGNFDMQIPAALGLNIRLNPLFSLQTQFDYNHSFIIKKHNLLISAGFVWTLGRAPEIKSDFDE